jgi:tetratricopeptide (TPR) repeat protein/tRNA A-37 threonylcarbamoyl transferase component Bud32
VGSSLGRFRLVEKVGGGGMGVVYRAFEDPPGREVALKLVRPEHLWFEGAHKRFVREVETVAAMQHPGIVPVYSCGDHDGVPFCAMEYVRGRSLADLIAELRRAKSPPDPSALRQRQGRDWVDASFSVALQVADALAHVHARGVVHRDVKPSNVMLDDAGQARLIDFGLARSTSHESVTRSGVQPGSLAYMSPEQVRGEEVDVRTDVWSLGVSLYELLTLQQPFTRPTEEATRRAILTGVPPRVSSTSSRIPWDAATVVATALAPETARRYPTMVAFAADLRAFLERRPIAARRASAALRARRWTQRHPAAAASLALGVVLLGVLPSTLLLREQAKNAEIAKEAERAKLAEQTSARVLAFLQDLFYEVDPTRARGTMVPARVILDRGVQRIRSELHDEPAVRGPLLHTMGVVYANLGLVKDGEDLLRECLRTHEREPLDVRTLHAARFALARVAMDQGLEPEAERLLRELLADQAGDEPSVRAQTIAGLARATWRQDREDEGLRLFDEALGLLVGSPPDDARALAVRRSRAQLLLARIDPQAGLAELREVHRLMRNTLRPDDPAMIEVTCDLGKAELDNCEPAAAEATLRAVEAVTARVFDRDHPQLALLRETLAEVLMVRDQPGAAQLELDRALATYVATYREPHYVIARARNLESSLALELGDLPRAERTARAALHAFAELFPNGSYDYSIALANLARVLLMVGNVAEAEQLGTQAVAMHESLRQKRPESMATAKACLGFAQALAGNLEQAEASITSARELVAKSRDVRVRAHVQSNAAQVLLLLGKGEAGLQLARAAEREWQSLGSEHGVDWARMLQGWAYNTLNKVTEAEQILRETLERRRSYLPTNHPILAHHLGELGVAIYRQRRLEEGLELLEQSVAIRRQIMPPDNPLLALPLFNLAKAYQLQGKQAPAAKLGLEVLGILSVNVARDSRLVQPVVDLLLEALPKLADAELRRNGFETLRNGAAALLPEDHPSKAVIEQAAR